jgi:DNA-directed RNA polymerase beta' subunit
MMGMRAKILPGKTFKLNVSVCSAYNADFDGDEMNTHTCNSIVTHEELKNIASVPTQIISPSKCNPIIYFVQDSLVASYLMTQDDEKIYRPKLENLMMNIKTFDGKYPSSDGKDENGNEYWFGRTVYSIILPEISLKLKNDSDKMVTIKNGQFLEGNLDSTIIGKRGLIQDILKTYGTNRCHQFLDESQNMFTRWMETHGFSVGIGDGVPINKEMKDKIQEIIENKIEESKEVITSAYHGLYEQELDDTLRLKAMDLNMKKIGSDTVNDVLKYIKSKLTPDNRFNIMATSGAKGKSLNLQQIMGIVGQQEIWGTRILNGYSDRTLPHFHKNDFGLSAKGFVRNSYIRGVNPEEFFFSMMGGRVGMIDTAVKSVTGDTPILITENGKAKRVLIGEWIDNYLDNNLDKIENYEEKNLELFRTEDREFYIPTCDGKGNTSWGKITALTRHDPGNYLYKICTLGGREVKVPESKSLLIWNSVKEEYEEKLTPDVKIGDFVPTTMYLPKHNIECTHIDLTEYLPKDKYVYGTDFHIAYDLVFKKYNGKVPIGWWEKNNGNTFTLPYKHSHCLLRVVRRSNIDYIKKGFVYPYHGKRIETYIPEKFELNRENGVFMGLYLAEGVVDFKSGIISITKNDIEIQEFVKNWFDKYSIKWQINTKTNKFGTSTSIRGYSRILAELFEKWFSKGAAHKHLINEAYTASDDFVIGLLDGYFSGDGTIGKNCIEVGSASKELIEGIGSLCNRFGIFGKYFTTLTKNNNFGTKNILPSHRFSIRSLWAQKFADIIKLTNISKNNKLLTIKCTDIHRNFESQNDTVLDKIVSIELISVKEYPKLYDLTVPTTNNFALANGMNVYDTSETGYISRKLMKAAEDVKILYDGTVRNAANNIIQFVYGDDNYDPIKLEKITIDLIKYNNLEMEEKFKFNFVSDKDWENIILKSAMKDLLAVKDYQKILDEEYQILIDCRDKLRNEYFKNTDIIGIDTFMPFNLFKYLPAMKFKFNINDNNVSDLNPIYVIERVNELCVFATKYMKDNHNNILTKIIIKSFMSSKMIISHYKLNKLVFDYIIKELERKLMSAYVQPGEMVGPIAAQSLGESNQQLTLNTFHQAGSAAGSVAVTSGVPRMKEIISLSKTMKTPSMDIYLSQEYADDRSKAEKLKNLMKYTKMESIVIKTDIIYENIDEVGIDVNDDEDMEFIKLYYEFNDIVCADNHEDLSKWVLRIEFDREAMMSKNILMSDVEEAIKLNAHSEDAIQCIINDDNSSNLIMRVRVKSETEDENFLSFFKEFEKYIMDMTLKGIKGINAVDVVEGHIVKYNPDGSYTINKEWFLRTDGSNLTETMLMDNVNTTRTFTNDIIETYEIFGIEGVRAKIVKELFAIFSEQGVNQRHINLMVDIMTNRGIIMQIDRHGINRAPDNGVMTKASFEQVTDVFIKASIFNEVDKLTGVSANIMFGQLVPSGTNMFELLLDEEKLMNFGISEEEQQEFEQDELDEDVVQEELNEMYEDMDEELEIGDDDFEFGYSLENVQEYNLGPIKTEEESESVKVVDNTVVKKIIKKKK